ncbi:hypothetical protein GCM10007932_16730 [Vibrio penaeicida]|uniref:Uncharacterized protein n=1 Tax=Vibrio penaeicida TaxID=104609 RepID=A0AAV5NP65_9VIBR|nr:hypothetical protein GCM10007932_16730 [Vibrio penaeicida]
MGKEPINKCYFIREVDSKKQLILFYNILKYRVIANYRDIHPEYLTTLFNYDFYLVLSGN